MLFTQQVFSFRIFILKLRLWPEGSYELGFVRHSVSPSVLPFVCPEVFMGLAH